MTALRAQDFEKNDMKISVYPVKAFKQVLKMFRQIPLSHRGQSHRIESSRGVVHFYLRNHKRLSKVAKKSYSLKNYVASSRQLGSDAGRLEYKKRINQGRRLGCTRMIWLTYNSSGRIHMPIHINFYYTRTSPFPLACVQYEVVLVVMTYLHLRKTALNQESSTKLLEKTWSIFGKNSAIFVHLVLAYIGYTLDTKNKARVHSDEDPVVFDNLVNYINDNVKEKKRRVFSVNTSLTCWRWNSLRVLDGLCWLTIGRSAKVSEHLLLNILG